jgi:predicted O-methyltransferase YrrM
VILTRRLCIERELMFHEDWYSDVQLSHLRQLCQHVKHLPGSIVEIGCWEGKSTVAMANACFPEPLIAVDSWLGNLTERQHETVSILTQRDVYADFLTNLAEATKGNVDVRQQDCFEFLAGFDGPIKLCHVDAAHDYDSVRRTLEMLLPKMVTGGVLCGDDYINANINRTDLNGGVERACREMLPGHGAEANFWFWRRTLAAPSSPAPASRTRPDVNRRAR